MAKWYVNGLSKMTGLGVQTLHYYDRIDLLKPSMRQANDYRLYSEEDLVRVQQILALKSFGFKLSVIKRVLSKEITPMEQFKSQVKILDEKAESLLAASAVMKAIIAEHKNDKSIPWKKTIELIEVYSMAQKLEKRWAAKELSPSELKEYVDFESGLDAVKRQDFENSWAKIIAEIQTNIDKDPTSAYGIKVGKRCMDMVNNLYTTEHAGVKQTVWEKGAKRGHSDMPPPVVEWMDKAIDSYWRQRLYKILGTAGQANADTVNMWDQVMTEMFGDSIERRLEVVQVAMTDEKVSTAARNWLKSHYKISDKS